MHVFSIGNCITPRFLCLYHFGGTGEAGKCSMHRNHLDLQAFSRRRVFLSASQLHDLQGKSQISEECQAHLLNAACAISANGPDQMQAFFPEIMTKNLQVARQPATLLRLKTNGSFSPFETEFFLLKTLLLQLPSTHQMPGKM